MRREGEIRKNYVIHTLEIDFTLQNKRNKFINSVLTECLTKNIGGSIIYITLNISTYKVKSLYINIRGIWIK